MLESLLGIHVVGLAEGLPRDVEAGAMAGSEGEGACGCGMGKADLAAYALALAGTVWSAKSTLASLADRY